MNQKQPPIGYVLKQLDRAITAYTDKALQKHSLERIHWQILNVINDEAGDFAQILERMKSFLDEAQLREYLSQLGDHGWIEQQNGIYRMTASGDETLAAASQTQAEVRAQLVKGISQDEYAAVIGTLQKMLDNIA